MKRSIPRQEWLWLGLILLLAASLRLYRLDHVPPGLTHDEAGNGKLAQGVLRGERPIYFSVSNGREPLYVYSMAPLLALFGPNQTSLRLTSALWGLALILAVWAWARRAFNSVVAMLAAGCLAVGFWPLMVSRLGLASSDAAGPVRPQPDQSAPDQRPVGTGPHPGRLGLGAASL